MAITLYCYTGVLVVSSFVWSVALDSSDVLLPYSIMTLASPATIMLISTFFFQNNKHINLHIYTYAGPI